MSIFGGLLRRRRIDLSAQLTKRLERWALQLAAQDSTPIDKARLVVVDVETSGLNPRKDRLLEIGAVALESLRLMPGSVFSAVVRHEQASSRENILIHGIGPTQQCAGIDLDEALTAFLEFARRDVLVAFHAEFDQAVLERAARRNLGIRLPNPWIDLAGLAPALYPEARLNPAPLDDWLAYFGLHARRRHRAGDDALATGELLLIMLSRARSRGITTIAELRESAAAQARITSSGGAGGA